MFYNLLLINLLWLVSAAELQEEKPKIRNTVPLVISYHDSFYRFPHKARITEDQKQEFYYSSKKDGLHYCPIDDTEENNTTIKDLKYRYCLVVKKFKEGEDKTCQKQVKPIIIEKLTEQGYPEYCGSGSRQIYKFAYQICVKKSTLMSIFKLGKKTSMSHKFSDVQYTTTYEICYDHSKNRVIFTKHKIISAYILRNLRLEKEHAEHDFSQKHSTETYGLENLENLQKTSEAYQLEITPKNYQYELQMLTPFIDFALGHWMQTTFHLINYSPQHISRLTLWETINSYVNLKIIRGQKNPDIRIYTGTWGNLLKEKGKKVYLGNDRKLGVTIPKIWWKILYELNTRKAVVILMHNADNLEKICKPNVEACDVLQWGWRFDLEPYFILQNVYCCDVSSAKETIEAIDELRIGQPDDIFSLN